MEKYFLGSNTYKGFYGYYDRETAGIKRVYLIKGGAGTGKSSLMKKVLKTGLDYGYNVESWHCSGDPKSLDGVYIKELDTCLIDATSPHAVEPKIPAIKDKIVNLLEFVDDGKIVKYSDTLEKLIVDKKECFSCGYEHLNIAYCHYAQAKRLVARSMNYDKIKELAIEFVGDIEGERYCFDVGKTDVEAPPKNPNKKVSKRYVRAITPDGIVEFDDHRKDRVVWTVKGEYGSVDLFLNTVIERLNPMMMLYNPLVPDAIDGFTVGEIAVEKDCGSGCGGNHFNLGIFEGDYDRYAVSRAKAKMKEEIDLAVDYFSKARSVHMAIEQIYISAMDFDGVNRLTERLQKEIFGI